MERPSFTMISERIRHKWAILLKKWIQSIFFKILASLALVWFLYLGKREIEYQTTLLLYKEYSPPTHTDHRTSCESMELAKEFYHLIPPEMIRHQKIGILIVYDDEMWNPKMTELSIKNKQKYAAKHGYEILSIKRTPDIERPGGWFKLYALEQNLEKFDWLVYLDLDTIIMNYDIELEWLVAIGIEKK